MMRFLWVKLAIEDNLTTGRFVGHDYKAEFHRVLLEENLVEEYQKLINSGNKIFVVDLNEKEIQSLYDNSSSKDVIIFNVRSKSDSLRNDKCKKSLPYTTKLFNVIRCFDTIFVKKKWNKWFLVTGPDANDKEYADALKNQLKNLI